MVNNLMEVREELFSLNSDIQTRQISKDIEKDKEGAGDG